MKRLIIAMALSAAAAITAHALRTSDLVWHDASALPLKGTLAPDAEKAYSRLPDSLKGRIRPELWNLGMNSAGLAIRFRSDASALGMRWKSLNKFNMNHMTAAGIRGLDLYALDNDGTWQTVGSARPVFGDHNTTTMVVTDMTPTMREYMLYLPLYDGVDSIYIGTDSTATVLPPLVNSPVHEKPVIVYGTSIVQGGCANRPGMIHTSILGRMLNREFINLGFSGNARLDTEIAELIAQADPSIVVLDPLPNCKSEEIREKYLPFYRIIRNAHPEVPIVFVESILFPVMKWSTEVNETVTDKNNILRELYESIANEDKNVYYFKGSDIVNNRDATVDNYHLTDMGFSEFAKNFYPLLNLLLEKQKQTTK